MKITNGLMDIPHLRQLSFRSTLLTDPILCRGSKRFCRLLNSSYVLQHAAERFLIHGAKGL
jgi:hypothetical protein